MAASSSPPRSGWNSIEEELAYYKSQYETLEAELQEFQTSSKELEAELERDVEESEKRERKLQEKVESLGFEVEEWKTKYKQSKNEANNAQNTLQKEITALRDSHRTIQLKLRDIEVQNDDFERQTRNQTSSLEDLESKYNVAIERTVMLDEEIKIGEQEREALRIENQRLRDELSDLKIEAEIIQEKLRIAEQSLEAYHVRKTSQLVTAGHTLRPRSPISEASTSATTLSSSPTTSNPLHSKSALASRIPPSPPLSETSASMKASPRTPIPTRKTSANLNPTSTPRPGFYQSKPQRHSRGPTAPASGARIGTSYTNGRTAPPVLAAAPKPKPARPSTGTNNSIGGLPRSGSLYQIRGMNARMQNLEQRIKSAKSKLPAPTSTPPRASPRNGHSIPSTVTVRSNRKRASAANSSSSAAPNASGDSNTGVSRLSFGYATTPREQPSNSRPSSRASMASSQPGLRRPESRSSIRTPLGHYSSNSISGVDARSISRPRSSMSRQSGGGHQNIQSFSFASSVRESEADNSDGSAATPLARRGTIDKTSIPAPSSLPRRQSMGRRSSIGLDGEMGPPERPVVRPRKLSEVGETY
ncbi:hypothetical protein GQ43DRAFT_441359 [Delitschia confertaspora ATCC 74209]|uniref:NUDE domain-containing protein n=1 Tax=Delitschia confertaspora ATCC 74209 TaxID=1513339 RepID=A0A9P4MY95_9PLEO|nr:hypothetical protein GQ43DRAFT_441359 [Delitschia confertaspora ATCC 74209]